MFLFFSLLYDVKIITQHVIGFCRKDGYIDDMVLVYGGIRNKTKHYTFISCLKLRLTVSENKRDGTTPE